MELSFHFREFEFHFRFPASNNKPLNCVQEIDHQHVTLHEPELARPLLNEHAVTQVDGRLPKEGRLVMDPNSNISRKDIKEALVRAALKEEAFRESLLANPKFAVERALGTTLPDRLKVVLLQETDDLMYIVLPKDFPDDTSNLSDAELETIAGGFLSAETNLLSGQDPSL